MRTPVVLVMASCDPVLDDVREQLERLDIALEAAVNLQEFQRLIQQDQPAEVVITGVSLPDGNWCDVLASTVRAGSAARVLVCSQDADERFWSEAIWRGVYDILVAPFTTEYLQRSVDVRGPREPGGRTGEPNPNHTRETAEPPDTARANSALVALAAA